MIPLFPELKEHVEAAFHAAADGTEFRVNRYRDANQNLRTQLDRIIRRAGLEPWPKLFQNLRSTRQTELEEIFPSHVVCNWIGNTQAVAAKHYLQTTDEHFEKAVQNPVQLVQKAVQHPAAANRTDAQKSGVCESVRPDTPKAVAETGLEPVRGLPLTGL